MLQKHRCSILFPSIFPHLISLFFAVFACFSCANHHSPSYLQTAEELLWKNPDSCLIFLDSLEQEPISEHDAHVCALLRTHANFKINYGLDDDSVLFVLKDYFESIDDYRYAGEANYIIGRNLVVHQNPPLGTFYLKAAEENLLKEKGYSSRLLGATYYGLGDCAEQDRLFDIAIEYYSNALSLFLLCKDSLYLSGIYKNLAKLSTTEEGQFISLIDSAMAYSTAANVPYFKLLLEIYRNNNFFYSNPTLAIQNYHSLCDSLNIYTYATELCDYYLSEHDLKQAYHYLTLSALDTANSYWSLEHYLFNKATYLSEIGQKDSAIAVLQDLHLRQTAEIESSAFTRSYMVEQRYDAERERQEKLQAHAEKRMALLSLLLVIIAAILIISGILFLWWRDTIQKRFKIERNQHLVDKLRLQQEQLQQKLKQRIDLTTQITHLKTDEDKLTADNYKQLLDSITFTKHEQWDELIHDFDNAYAGLLSSLSLRCKLSDSDRVYIALIALGCSNEDIAILTNVTPHSASTRKQRLKQRLHIEGQLEDWLQSEIQNSLSRLLQ